MGDWQSKRSRLLAGERDDLGNLLRCKRRRRPGAVAIAQHVDDEVLQVCVGDRFQLSGVQQVHRLGEPAAPSADALPIDAECLGLVDGELALGGRDHDPSALNDAVLRRRRPDEMVEDRPLTRQENNNRRMARHPRGMIQAFAEEKRRYFSLAALGRFPC